MNALLKDPAENEPATTPPQAQTWQQQETVAAACSKNAV
jgi:hypothetical protein